MTEEQPTQKPGLFAGMWINKRYVIKSSILILAFWLIEFMSQFLTSSSGNVNYSIIRSSAFAAATLISIALILGPLARISKYNFIFHRRTLAVWGFSFGIVHVISVVAFALNFNISALFWATNPFVNPTIFGIIAFIIFMPVYITSTDWHIHSLGFMKWKKIQSLVYIAYIFLVLHYLTINIPALYNPEGYLLLATTLIAAILQITAFAKTVRKTHSKKSLITGIIILLFTAALFYAAYAK